MVNITKEELINLYINKNLTLYDISELYNTKYSSIKLLVRKYQIKKSRKDVAKTTCERNLKKYGVRGAMQRKDVQEKAKQTFISHYGTDNPLKSDEIKQKVIKTNLEKYGVEYTCQDPKTRQKMEHTNLQKYGSISPLGNNEIRSKADNTKLNKYGSLKTSSNPIYEKYFINEETARQFIKDNYLNKPINEIAANLGYSLSNMTNIIHKYDLYDLVKLYSNTSSYETEIENILKSWGIDNIIRNKKFKELNNLELDIYLPDYNIGIEFNGNYWHNEAQKNKKYHQNKSLLGEKNNIFVYHIFEYEWNNSELKTKIINQLKNITKQNQIKIYARKCIIKNVSSKDKSLFLKENHLQGNDKSNINLGLYYNNELVSLMTFTKSRFNSKYNWELSRFCSKSNSNVIGGANKLFAYFIKTHKNESIISYSNISKTKGNLYQLLGFQLDHISSPNYIWWKHSDIKTRYQCQMKNEKQIMQEKGYLRIFDSGNKVWIYNK